jgi:predicted transcriptional regulator
MSTQVTLTLPDEVYRRAERLAQLSSRDVADVLADTIELSLSPLGLQSEAIKPISALSDDEVMALVQLQMEPDQDQSLSRLLDRQQAGHLQKHNVPSY